MLYNFYKYFIAYGDYLKKENRMFKIEHWFLLFIITLFIILVLKNTNEFNIQKRLRFFCILMFSLELLRIIWWLIYREFSFMALRFDLCNQICLWMPLLILFNFKKTFPFLIACSLLGGIIVLAYPLWVFYDYGGLHIISIQSMFSHGLMVIIPILILRTYKIPSIKNHIVVTTLLYVILNSLAYYFSITRNANYMSLIRPDGVLFLQHINPPYHLFFMMPGLYLIILSLLFIIRKIQYSETINLIIKKFVNVNE